MQTKRIEPATVDSHAPPPRFWEVVLRPRSQDERNQRNVLIDGIGVALVGGIGTFLSVFLVRLGASNLLIGLLSSMPALTGMLLAIPVGEFLSRRPNIVPWFSRARLLVLLCYALTGLLPFFVRDRVPEAVIVIWALATLPQTIVTVAFTVVMGEVSGPGGRFTMMSRRWSIMGLTNALTVLAVGQMLRLFQFPLNYQLIFIGSAVGGLLSFAFSSSIKLSSTHQQTGHAQPFWQMLREHGRTLRQNRTFVNFTFSQFLYRWGMALPAPLFPIYWVRNLGASDATISAVNGVQTAIAMLAYLFWARMSQRHNVRWVLLATVLGVSFYPLLTALTRNPNVLILWGAMVGFFSAGVELVMFDILLKTCPEDDQAAYVGMYQTTAHVASFLGPLLGTALAALFGIVPAMIFGTVMRLAGFAAMALLGVARPQPLAPIVAEAD